MKKILVIDDSVTSRALFKAYVPANQYAVCEASDLATALASFISEKPDICVIDYNLPGVNGVEIAKQLLEKNIPTKLILMTANTQKTVLETAKAIGFDAIMEKPISTDAVVKTLESLG